jgi:type II secretory pathway pseudopilin PulG
MDFLYFPEDKSEYIPGIISVIIIFILSLLIVWLLVKASRKQVKQLEEQGYPVVYHKNSDTGSRQENKIEIPEKQKDVAVNGNKERDKKS